MTDTSKDWRPFDDDEHEAQLRALLALFSAQPLRLIDIGAGDGRIAVPLARAGHDVLAIDNDPDAVRACEQQGVSARRVDVLHTAADLSHPRGDAHAALCLGHTFMLFHDPEQALALLMRIESALAPGGLFVIDNFPDQLWTDVHEGAWVEGVSEDESMQILWVRGENVFALREGDAVDPDNWTITPDDRLHRLWSLGELRLLASVAGLEGPTPDDSGQLLLFRTQPAA